MCKVYMCIYGNLLCAHTPSQTHTNSLPHTQVTWPYMLHIDFINQLIDTFSRYFYRPLAPPAPLTGPRALPPLWFHARSYICHSFAVVPLHVYVPDVGPRKVRLYICVCCKHVWCVCVCVCVCVCLELCASTHIPPPPPSLPPPPHRWHHHQQTLHSLSKYPASLQNTTSAPPTTSCTWLVQKSLGCCSTCMSQIPPLPGAPPWPPPLATDVKAATRAWGLVNKGVAAGAVNMLVEPVNMLVVVVKLEAVNSYLEAVHSHLV